MRHRRRSTPKGMLVVLAGSVLSAWPMLTQGAEPEITADLAAASAYVWRGQVIHDEATLQPSLTVGFGAGFSANLWGDFPLGGDGSTPYDFDEIDFTVSWAGSAGGKQVELGLIAYTFPHSSIETTTEVFGSVGLLDRPLEASVAAYFDIDEAEGAYVSLDLGRELEFGPRTAVAVGLSASWAGSSYNNYYFSVPRSAWNDWNVRVGSRWSIREGLAAEATLVHTWLPDGDIRTAARGLYADDRSTTLLLSLSYTFLRGEGAAGPEEYAIRKPQIPAPVSATP